MTYYILYFKTFNALFEQTHEELPFFVKANALDFACKVSTCKDVVSFTVDVVDGETGEVVATYEHGEATYLA